MQGDRANTFGDRLLVNRYNSGEPNTVKYQRFNVACEHYASRGQKNPR
ncbi:hypothetical protein [uncultured Nostoc sp.]|nr:hypothetical protein [uncultured Nostoc sp.]